MLLPRDMKTHSCKPRTYLQGIGLVSESMFTQSYLKCFNYRPDGALLESTLREKRVPKRCSWGTIATNGTLFSKGHSFFPVYHITDSQIVLLGVLFRYPFFSECNMCVFGKLCYNLELVICFFNIYEEKHY